MTQQIINVGTAPNDGYGDPIRTAFIKSNNNFSQLYSRAQPNPPATLYGTAGDQAGMYAYDSSFFYYCFANYTGNTIIWSQLEQAGNITATNITYGNSNVKIAVPSANVSISVNNTANVAIISNIGLGVTGVISATGNVRGGNINTAGAITATGNITGSYFLGNGSQLTGVQGLYGNSNVQVYLPTYTGSLYPTNIYTNGYFYANGTPFAGGGGGGGGGNTNYNDSNVAAFLPTYTGNLAGGNLALTGAASVTGNVTVLQSMSVAQGITGNVTGNTAGIHNGLVYSIDIRNLSFDFGYIAANTYTNPMQYLFAVTPAGNLDMGTITAPASTYIDVGTLSY